MQERQRYFESRAEAQELMSMDVCCRNIPIDWYT